MFSGFRPDGASKVVYVEMKASSQLWINMHYYRWKLPLFLLFWSPWFWCWVRTQMPPLALEGSHLYGLQSFSFVGLGLFVRNHIVGSSAMYCMLLMNQGLDTRKKGSEQYPSPLRNDLWVLTLLSLLVGLISWNLIK